MRNYGRDIPIRVERDDNEESSGAALRRAGSPIHGLIDQGDPLK